MRRFIGLASCLALFSFELACSGDPVDAGGADATIDAGTRIDATVNDDATIETDAGREDDAAIGMDVDSPDARNMAIEPGQHVELDDVRIAIGDAFADVKTKMGAGARSMTENARSYDYNLGGVELTIWYANTNLDDDDAVPNDVDDTDRVLWIAVSGAFTGKTSRGIGLGSSRVEVEAAYGAAPHTVDITAPAPGVLAQYYTTGFLVAFDSSGPARTVTICRAYTRAPDGVIDHENGRLDFGAAGSIRGLVNFNPGSQQSDVTALLGEPDARGDVVISNQTLGVMSYGFIGIEVLHSNTPGLERTLFLSVHAPYYGNLSGSMAGIGETRAEIEAALGLGQGLESPMNMRLVCYEGANNPDVAVTYSADATARATTITTPLVRSAMSTTCP